MAKQFTKEEKLIVIEYSRTNSSVKTVKKFNINLSTLKRWKREVKNFGKYALEWENGSNTKPIQQKRLKKNKNFKKISQNYESMTRSELIERAKFGDALKRYSIKSIKDKFFIIDTLKENFTVRFLFNMLEISTFGYYKWKNNGRSLYNKWDNNVAEKISNIYYGFNKVYGYNMISMLLFKIYQITISPHVVYRYMKNLKIRAIRRKRNFKYKIEQGTMNYKNLLNRNFYADKVNKLWVTDIAYVLTNTKTHYLSIVRDLYNGEIIDYQISNVLSFEFVYQNIIRAWYKANKPNGVILHSDHGGHYTNMQYKILCQNLGITISMSRKGNSIDNGACETWFSSFKQEAIYSIPRKLLNEKNIYSIIENYIEFYNFIRPMNKLKKMSPIEYRWTNP